MQRVSTQPHSMKRSGEAQRACGDRGEACYEGGKIDLYYAGFGNQQWYDIQPDQTNLITPLFLLIPFWDDGKNIHGMHWLGHVATDAPHS